MKMPINSPTAICQSKNFVYIISPDFLLNGVPIIAAEKRRENRRERKERKKIGGRRKEGLQRRRSTFDSLHTTLVTHTNTRCTHRCNKLRRKLQKPRVICADGNGNRRHFY